MNWKEYVKNNLHSTVVLLKGLRRNRLFNFQKDLHSTVVLLKVLERV